MSTTDSKSLHRSGSSDGGIEAAVGAPASQSDKSEDSGRLVGWSEARKYNCKAIQYMHYQTAGS